MAFNKKAHLRENIDAIKTAFLLEKENRRATPEERALLERYAGFGGIKAILNPLDEKYWNKTDLELLPLVTELHEVLKKNSKDEAEYKRYVNSLKNSILSAFYTPAEVVNALADSLYENAMVPAKMLDPSAGTGIFAEAFSRRASACRISCFEKDLLTGKILSRLRPQDLVHIEGFENIESRYTNYYDVLASNIPFGELAVYDPLFSTHQEPARRIAARSVHNYFFMKAVDKVREGGIVAFITSQGVLNAEQNRPVREWLMERCELVSAVRLPNNLFTDHAGTEVGSDLVILQRSPAGSNISKRRRDFIESRRLSNGIQVNNTFQNFDRIVQTASKVGTDPYGKPALVFTHEGGTSGIAATLREMLREDFSKYLDIERYLLFTPETSKQTVSPQQELSQRKATPEPDREEHSLGFADVLPEEEEIGESQTRKSTQELDWEEHSLGFKDVLSAEDLADMRRHNEESKQIPPVPTPEGLQADVTVSPNTSDPVSVGFKDSLFGEEEMEKPSIKKQASEAEIPLSANQQPLVTLYDLFGFSEEERRQVIKPRSHKKKRVPAAMA